jgi:hypothetical protein
MKESRYNWINNVLGWLIFAIAATVYLMTIEPTNSLWDCGEFIAGSHKLQVVHPPGSPFFLMLNHFFTSFVSDVEMIPVVVNASSAIASAFCILFLFWSITLLARKILLKNLEKSNVQSVLAVMFSGVIGALAYTFSDSFWFSAVEGEVYALSSFFIALVFWLILKWERRTHKPNNLRWIILIAYLMGLSIGVHLLSLLALPVIAFVYYFKKSSKVTPKGVIYAGIIGLLILFVVNVVVIQWFPIIASKFDLLFVNSFGLPLWSGVLFALFLLFALLGLAIYYTHIRKKVFLNVILLTVTVVFIGFSSYTSVAIRSMANTPINYSSPDNIFSMISYINREQYGDRPLLYGPYFTAGYPIDFKKGRKLYYVSENEGKAKYIFNGYKRKAVYDPDHYTIFPRMSDSRADRKEGYMSWSGMRKNQKKPTFGQNIKFFIRYQLGHMYWRYFAWNFIGRQNDEQGHGEFMYGNWVSGIPLFDDNRTGPLKEKNGVQIPYHQRINKAHNTLYFLPFILGLLGLYFHFKNQKKDAVIVLVMFFITGVLLILYLNSPPFEPRERDYVTVGSFYFYAIWIGLGLLQLIQIIQKWFRALPATFISFIIALLAVPVLMATEEWDDHDRSKSYTSKDYGINYLNSCDSNAILFTNGDNDTYPLWYVQEVEGIRDDVRVINLQLLMTDWYAAQLQRKINNSDAISISFEKDQIVEGKRDQIFFYDKHPHYQGVINPNRFYDLKEIIAFIASDDPRTKIPNNPDLDFYPTKKFSIPVDQEKVIANGTVRPEMADRIVDVVQFNIHKNSMLKNSLLVLDIIAENGWERPVCFAITSGSDTYLNLDDYLQQQGMVYRLVPIKRQENEKMRGETGRVDPEIMYDNIMNKFKWGNLMDEDVNIESVTRRHCLNYRNVFATLGKVLLAKGELEKVIALMDKCQEVIPEFQVPHRLNSIQIVELYLLAGAVDKGLELMERLKEVFTEEVLYYRSLKPALRKQAENEMQRSEYGLQVIGNMEKRYDLFKQESENTDHFEDTFEEPVIQQKTE